MTVRLRPAALVLIVHPTELADAAKMGDESADYLRWLCDQRLVPDDDFGPDEPVPFELTETGRRTLTRHQHACITDAACVPGPRGREVALTGDGEPSGATRTITTPGTT